MSEALSSGTGLQSSSRVRLASRVRLSFDASRGQRVLLGPETVTVLNPTAAAILDCCDGERTIADIVAELSKTYSTVAEEDVIRFLARLVTKRNAEVHDA